MTFSAAGFGAAGVKAGSLAAAIQSTVFGAAGMYIPIRINSKFERKKPTPLNSR